ncbi:MAG: glycosyltransferase [Gemmataceae bacterium]
MSASRPALSLIVPTRGRPALLTRFLKSLAATARAPQQFEVILVVDSDDAPPTVPPLPFQVRVETGPPGRTMGELNNAGFAASCGDFIMLLNDDVIVRTRGWDRTVLRQFRRFPDRLMLVHVNDTLIRDHLCTFPILSREYLDLIGSFCPAEYERYRIDDHLQDPFDMLAAVGVRRTVWLPDVVFEHCNSVNHPEAGAVYESDPAILARDAPRFDAMLPVRKAQAIRVLERIAPEKVALIEPIHDSFALRTTGRQITVRPLRARIADAVQRAIACHRRGGFVGLFRAATRRLA